ncbi:MAG: ACT domain-containing protein [Leptospirales bacterium]|nr:ACT domain-containing protein [Leptospirales bacterium]
MNVTQVSVFMQNQPGHLQKVLKTLADGNINIISLTIAESEDFGVLRLIVDNPENALDFLTKNNIRCSSTDVLAIEIGDEPGSLYRAIDSFSKMSLNIEYMYAFSKRLNNSAVMIFRFDDIEAAKKALEGTGHKLIKNADITGG